jgi:TRAP-type C4-dicarboxylate transport system permease small subunit
MKNLSIKFGSWIATLPILLLPVAARATLTEATTELTTVGQAIGTDVTTNSLPDLIGEIINILLSVLGIVFVVLIVYAGYLYLTDAGGGEHVKKAKNLLTTSIIGLVIIIAAYAIANYVISALAGAAVG